MRYETTIAMILTLIISVGLINFGIEIGKNQTPKGGTVVPEGSTIVVQMPLLGDE